MTGGPIKLQAKSSMNQSAIPKHNLNRQIVEYIWQPDVSDAFLIIINGFSQSPTSDKSRTSRRYDVLLLKCLATEMISFSFLMSIGVVLQMPLKPGARRVVIHFVDLAR